jgi:hypothetical protein
MDAPSFTQLPRKSTNGSPFRRRQSKPVLTAQASAGLRDELIAELGEIKDNEGLALWAHRRLVDKNTLTAEDARAIEKAYQTLLARTAAELDDPETAHPGERPMAAAENAAASATFAAETGPLPNLRAVAPPLQKPIRRRKKAHRAFVASQPCLVCQRSPCDAHHLKFAQPRTLGRRVSDEFTVPLCRDTGSQPGFCSKLRPSGGLQRRADRCRTPKRLLAQTA